MTFTMSGGDMMLRHFVRLGCLATLFFVVVLHYLSQMTDISCE